MSTNLGSSSACRDHHWKEANGVCHSCLTERLLSATCASKATELSTTYTDSADKSLSKEDSNRASYNLSEDISIFPTADASFSWQSSKSPGNGGLQHGGNSKEFLRDTEDDPRICLVYFDSYMAESDYRYSQDKSFKVAHSRRKESAALAGLKGHCSRSSSLRMDPGSKPEKKHKILRTPSTSFRRLFASTKTTMDRCSNHQSEESYDQPDPKAGLIRTSPVRQGILSSDCKSNSLKKASSMESDGSDARESQRSDLKKIQPLKSVLPVTFTGWCHDRITKTMKHESVDTFPYQFCSKESIYQPGGRPVWRKDITSPLRIFTKNLSYKSHEKDQDIDLDKHFQGATTSWSITNTLVEWDRRQSYRSPAHTAFYKEQSQLSFKSSPMQMGTRRRRKGMESRHGIFHLSPCFLGNDGWKLLPLANGTQEKFHS
ncbi:hypothetical protein O6H91_13G058200 [Diphasiastrum complanatum]|uniref:Uncharacterized protein n=1 Tax=Diphasiastrum complanatum TaxID=34168 RepID=A0ACC2BV19_DIPCM|nr:hypothetical protein O6H91_13G058200 [Diphasiastrum complanatum]